MTPYRTLVFARIVQESALSVGGNQPHILVDSPLARDGLNRPVLRGSTLAGCFIATARAISGTLPRAVAEDARAGRSDQNLTLTPSAWRFSNAHPVGTAPASAFFQHVSIDARTQSAKDGHLFNLEALPANTRWNFELEITPTNDTDFAELEALAGAVLSEWQHPGGVRLGHGSRHGYGWCHLENVAIVRLDTRHTRLWPDAFAPERGAEEWLAHFHDKGATAIDLNSFLSLHRDKVPKCAHRTAVELSGTLHIGERRDEFGAGYGLDTLSIGGHARMQLQAGDFFQRVIPPREIPFPEKDFNPDFAITAMPGPGGQFVPYVPGASIRGIWRAHIERHLRANGDDNSLSETLFGSTARAGHLSVADATLADDDWRLLWQQHVAIDEFSGGTYGSAKFDRLGIARACFNWRARIEADSADDARSLAQAIKDMLESLGQGHLPLGGGIWRGHGHILWKLENCRERRLGVTADQGVNQ